jgi:uncharacterized protein YrrD
MRILFLIASIFAVTGFGLSNMVYAQTYGQMFEDLNDLNVGKPLQDPRFDRIDEIIERKVQDKKNKVVGNVTDVLLTARGNIDSLTLEFNRLGKRNDITMSYQDGGFKGVSDAYIMTLYSDDQIENLYPSLLANIPTAAGDDGILSTKNVIGARVKTNNGEVVGIVDDVLFDNSGDRARGIYVNMKKGNFRGLAIAMPFASLEYDFTDRYRDIILNKEQTRALFDYAEAL